MENEANTWRIKYLEANAWRIKKNREVRELFRAPDIITEARNRRLEWTGLVIGREKEHLEEESPKKKIRRQT